MSQLKVEKQTTFSLMRILVTFFNLLLDVFTGLFSNGFASIKNIASVVVRWTKLSSDNFYSLFDYSRNKEPSNKKNAEDFLVTWFRKNIFFEIWNMKETPLQLFGSCDKIVQPAFVETGRFIAYPIFKTKMII